MPDIAEAPFTETPVKAGVEIRQTHPRGMVTLKADLSDPAVQQAVQAQTGCPMPETRRITESDDYALFWMAPDEVLVMCDRTVAADLPGALAAVMEGLPHLAVDMSDARVVFAVDGPEWRNVLGKLTPADLREAAFGSDELRRTRLAQVPAAIWRVGAVGAKVMVFRSVAQYAYDLLCTAAKPGSGVGYYR